MSGGFLRTGNASGGGVWGNTNQLPGGESGYQIVQEGSHNEKCRMPRAAALKCLEGGKRDTCGLVRVSVSYRVNVPCLGWVGFQGPPR